MKIMCVWCKRGPREPHRGNCPELTGVHPRSDGVQNQRTRRKTGAYLRRGRADGNALLPNTIYLVETRVEPDTPEGLYAEDQAVD